jgi:phospholipid N-methyltransferase
MFSFLAQAIKNTYHTGSVWPSSPALARVMTRSFREAPSPRRILEVGPGTGPLTKPIHDELGSDDEFHIVEINEDFCDDLESRLLEPFRREKPDTRVELHRMPIEETEVEGSFDFIVCGLPFNNFPPGDTRAIFKSLMSILKPDGELVYFEYAGVREMRSTIVGRNGRAKIRRINAHGKSMRRRFSGSRELVIANLPPAYAVRLQGSIMETGAVH